MLGYLNININNHIFSFHWEPGETDNCPPPVTSHRPGRVLGGPCHGFSFRDLPAVSVHSREQKRYFWGPELTIKDKMDETQSNNKQISHLDAWVQNALSGFLHFQVHDTSPANPLPENTPLLAQQKIWLPDEFGFKTKYIRWWQLDSLKLCYVTHNFVHMLSTTNIYINRFIIVSIRWDSNFWLTGTC